MSFTNAGTGLTETVDFSPNTTYTLEDIAARINDDQRGISFVHASIIFDGAGVRLRIANEDGYAMNIFDNKGMDSNASFANVMALEVSTARTSNFLRVRDELENNPGLISRGTLLWDATLGTAGEYYTSESDNSAALAMVNGLSGKNNFNSAGGLATNATSFQNYSAGILARNAQLTAGNQNRVDNLSALYESLKLKSDNERGVNLDQEMSELILYQQAYAAAARVISTIQAMLEDLQNAF